MALLEQWQKVAYNEKADRGELQRFWQRYFLLEKGVYEKLLTNPDEKVEGTVKELADKYGLSIMDMTGFLDGINESLVEPNPIDTMEEDTKVSLVFDKEKLYKNMVDAKADWLYELPMWNDIFDPETKKRLYLEQKKSGTVIVGKKVGRNDPCPCGSGKKYKFCCGVSTGSRAQGKYRYVVLPFFLCNRKILPAVEKKKTGYKRNCSGDT